MNLSNKVVLSTTIAVVITIPVLIFSVYYSTKGILRRNIEKNHLQIARNTMDTIDRIMEDACEDIWIIANKETIAKCLARLTDNTRQKGASLSEVTREAAKKELENSIEKAMLLSKHWYTLAVVDNAGNIVGSTHARNALSNINNLPQYKLAFNHAMHGKKYYSDLLISQDTGMPTVIFSAPVQSPWKANKKITGAVIGSFAWAAIGDLLESLPATINVQLFNRGGYLIAGRACNRNVILEKSLTGIDPVKKIVEGIRNSSSYLTGYGEFGRVYGVAVQQKGLHDYKGNRWGLLLEVPSAYVMEPIAHMSRNIILVILACSGLFMASIFLITKRITLPIRNLTRMAVAIGQGNYSTRIAVTSKDEIGVLADTFNLMTENIEKHINERKQREALLRRQAQMLDLANDPVIMRDFDDRITYWNHAAEIQYGWKSEEVLGQYPHELLKTIFPIPQDEIIVRLFKEGSWEGEGEQICRGSAKIIVWSRYKLLKDEDGRITGVMEINRDITERKKAEETIRNLSMTDELTGIYNRRGFITFSQQALKIAGRMKNAVTLLFADIDGLKWINDNLGHEHGDKAILDTAHILKITFRDSDIISRIGGDEFAVVMTGGSLFHDETIAARLQENIEKHNREKDREYRLSISIGMVQQDFAQPKSMEDLLVEADTLMYEQKRKKKEKMKTVDYRKVG